MPLFTTQKPPQTQLVRTISYPQRGHAAVIARQNRGRRAHRFPALIMIASVLVAGALLSGIPSRVFGGSDPENKKQLVAAAPKEEPIQKLDFTASSTEINAIIAKYKWLDIGVAVVDVKTDEVLTYGVQEPFMAASTAKLLTAILYLHNVEQGKATMSQPIGTRTAEKSLEAMIVDSDNAAWDGFNNGVLSHDELATYAAQIGFTNYDPDKNTTTPDNIAKLLKNLHTGKLLNKDNTTKLEGYMARSKEAQYIMAAVPSGTKAYHKAGYLSDRVHDAAIIDNGKRPFVLVIFTKSRVKTYDYQEGATIFHQITNSVSKPFFAAEK